MIYSIAIPVYNAENSLKELIDRLANIMNEVGKPYEIILVNDSSSDGSWELVKELKVKYPQIKAFDLMNNVGQFKALMCAFENATGEYIITMDDDLQNPPEEIPRLIEAITNNTYLDCIFGVPLEKKHPFHRNMGTMFIKYLNYKIFDKPRELKTSSFRIFRRHINEGLVLHKTRNPAITPLILKHTKRVGNVTVNHCARKHGTSGYGFFRLAQSTLDNVINFSTLPLKLLSSLGLIASMASLVLTVFYTTRYFQGAIKVQGWITLVLLLTFFSGLILFSIGLVGEYLIRIIEEVNHSPRYVIRDKL